jgi:frataxin-like iron-binding protein CyaY
LALLLANENTILNSTEYILNKMETAHDAYTTNTNIGAKYEDCAKRFLSKTLTKFRKLIKERIPVEFL